MLIPGALIPFVSLYFCDSNGVPVQEGRLYSFVTGSDDPQDTYADAQLTIANPNPIELTADGRPPDPIFLGTRAAYAFTLTATVDGVEDVQIWQISDIQSPQAFAATFGTVQSEGQKDLTSGGVILSTDRLVTVDSTGTSPTVVTLLPAEDATNMLVIKNVGTSVVNITPDGADTIDGTNALFALPAAAGQDQPSVILISDGVSSWFVIGSHLAP